MGGHAFMSPSFAHIGYRCAASALRSFQVKQRMELLGEIAPEYYGVTEPLEVERLEKILEEDNSAADEGTALHSVFEDALNDLMMKKSDVIRAIVNHPDISKGTKDDEYIIGEMLRLVKEFREFNRGCDWFVVEKKVKVRGLPQYGTVDLVGAKGRTLHVKDLKTGYLGVEPEDNEQLMTYATGVLDEVDAEGVTGWERFDQVELEIIGLRWKAESWTVSVEDVKSFKHDVMYPAFINAYAINPVATPGDHCKYCAGKIHCGAWQDKFSKIVNETYSEQDIRELGNDELVSMWKMCKAGETLMKQQLGTEIMQRFDGFDPPTNIKRVSGRRNVTFTVSEDELVTQAKTKLKSTDDLYKKDLKTPLQIQKLLKITDEDLQKITKTVQYSPYLQG